MAGRGRRIGTGLLIASVLFLTVAVLSAQEQIEEEEEQEEDSFRVLVHISKEEPTAGTTWTLSLFIEHSEPNQVVVLAPPFTDMIFLDRMLKSPRIVGADIHGYGDEKNEGEPYNDRWTVTEFHFTLNSPGTLFFDSFTIMTPLGQVKTEPLEVIISEPPETVERPHYRFSWVGTPANLKTGESAVISLSLTGRNRTLPSLPEYGVFIPMVPPGHILEFIPVSSEETKTGIALKIRLIPLTVVPLTLDRRMFTYDNAIFEIPSLRIPVSRQASGGPVRANENIRENTGTEIQPESPQATPQALSGGRGKSRRVPHFPSPENAVSAYGKLYTKYKLECENIFNTARIFWREGRHADSLAVLRRNERDHKAGILIAVLRREAEQALGFTGTNNEKKDNPIFSRRNKPRPAVVRETTVHRIPDLSGAEITRFNEGQPVLVLSENDRRITPGRGMSWLQVITNDSAGSSGWVPEEKIIFY